MYKMYHGEDFNTLSLLRDSDPLTNLLVYIGLNDIDLVSVRPLLQPTLLSIIPITMLNELQNEEIIFILWFAHLR